MTKWSSIEVMNLCIRRNWYTHGDCEEYERMLRFVREHEPTDENLRKVAIDIAIHSGLDFYDDEIVDLVEADIFAFTVI